jgi:phosphoribosylanthranilate isomerase
MPYRARIKVCGITRPQDALVAVQEGVDALGLVFYPSSPRYVSIAMAEDIVRTVPAFVSVVALFVDACADDVREVMRRVQPDLLQFHGAESAAYCESFAHPYLKALRVRDQAALERQASQYHSAKALLLDTYKPGVPGGTGQTFNWDLIPAGLRTTSVLAGGLDAGNVASAIQRVQPFAVDVSGGVEREKGIKDAAKIRQFVQQVQLASQSI